MQGVTNINGATVYYAHEVGVNEVDALGNKTAIPAFIQSGDFDLAQGGDGQFFMSMRRFIPDFKLITGDAQITINLRRFPADTASSSPLREGRHKSKIKICKFKSSKYFYRSKLEIWNF